MVKVLFILNAVLTFHFGLLAIAITGRIAMNRLSATRTGVSADYADFAEKKTRKQGQWTGAGPRMNIHVPGSGAFPNLRNLRNRWMLTSQI
jgi:hypothetical protein